jgi:hypothetical protein
MKLAESGPGEPARPYLTLVTDFPQLLHCPGRPPHGHAASSPPAGSGQADGLPPSHSELPRPAGGAAR